MAQPLPRAFRRQEEALDRQKLDRIVGEVDELEASMAAGATSGGDWRRLRGVPIQARRVRGAIAGSVPGERLE